MKDIAVNEFDERLALEGNSVFQSIRCERDALKQTLASAIAAIENEIEGKSSGNPSYVAGFKDGLRVALRQLRGEK